MSVVIERVKNTPRPPLPILLCSKVSLCIWPVAHIAVGAVYLNECPKEHYIPIYLVVMGVFSLMLVTLAFLPCAQEPKDMTIKPLHLLCTVWNFLVSIFVFCWFIAGNVWIYRIYEPNYVKNETMIDTYCHKPLYLFAFWTITLNYIILGVFLVVGCCFCLCGHLILKTELSGPE